MKIIRIKQLGIFLLLLLTNAAFALDAKWEITGTIIEETSGQSIPYATVALYQKSDSSVLTGTMSDDDGKFEITKIAAGDYYLIVSFMGYKDYTIYPIILNEDERITDIGVIKLKPNLEVLNEVIVTSKVKAIINSIDKQVLNVNSNLSATGGSAADALKLSPSIQIDSDNNVKLRGSSNFIVLINGKPTTLSPDDVLKQTPANSISKIEVITNPSVKYSAEGGAGVINIILKKNVTIGLNGIINAGVGSRSKYSADANINLNKEKASYSFGFDWRDYTKVAYNNYYRTLNNEDNTHYASMLQDRRITNSNLGFRFGIDYNPNAHHKVE